MRFLPALRRAVPDGPREEKVFLSDYYAGQVALGATPATGGHRPWDVDRAVYEAYEQVVWAFAAVEAISTSASRLPFAARKGDTALEDHPLFTVLNRRANPLESGRQFRKRLSAQVLLSRKGAFVEITKSRRDEPIRADLLPPARTFPVPGDGANLLSHYELRDVNGRTTRDRPQVGPVGPGTAPDRPVLRDHPARPGRAVGRPGPPGPPVQRQLPHQRRPARAVDPGQGRRR